MTFSARRFIACDEAGCSKGHQEAVLDCDHDGTTMTLIFSGRPLRARATPLVMDWEQNRQAEIRDMLSKGIVPVDFLSRWDLITADSALCRLVSMTPTFARI